MLKLGTKFSSIQEQLLQQERKERVTTLGTARNKQAFSTWNNTSLTFRAALNSSQSPCKQEEIAEKIVCVNSLSLSIVSLSFLLLGALSLSVSLSLFCFDCLLFLSSEALNLLLSSLVLLCVGVSSLLAPLSFVFPFLFPFIFPPWGLGFCNPFWLPTSPSTLTHAVSTNLNMKTNFKFLMNFRFYLLCSNSNHFLPLLACFLDCF